MIIVTGAAGYVGSHLIYELQKKNKVLGVDNFFNSSVQVIKSIKKYDLKDNFRFMKVDCTKYKDLEKIFKIKNIETVIHCAALKNVNESMKNKKSYKFNNEISTKNLLKLVTKYRSKYFIHCSTAALYDSNNTMPLLEDSNFKITSPYASTKLNSEKYIINSFKKDNHSLYFIIRFFNPLGANKKLTQHNDLNKNDLITNIKKSILQNKELKIYGNTWPTKDGTPVRDFFSILDLVDAIKILIVKLKTTKIKKSLIFNLGSGRGYTILDTIKLFERVTKKKIKYRFIKRLNHEVYKSIASIKFAKKVLKWKPKRSLKSALKSSWDYSNSKY